MRDIVCSFARSQQVAILILEWQKIKEERLRAYYFLILGFILFCIRFSFISSNFQKFSRIRRPKSPIFIFLSSQISPIPCIPLRSFFPFFLDMKGAKKGRPAFGKMGFGCKHYRRRCKIRAPCCNEVYGCRHCHNEAMSSLKSSLDLHEVNRNEIKKVICSVCDTEQPIAHRCANCGVNMGEYFCKICKFYDDDIQKKQFHCNDCGICRVGGRDNFFHCKKCGSCYSISLLDNHLCVENSMRHQCPICYEYLFDSLKGTTIMKCGHTMHCECYDEMIKHEKYCCPICSKSVMDMTKTWKRIDEEIEATAVPEMYRNKKVWILCNDCNDKTEVVFHIIGQKCRRCQSYNTRTIRTPVLNPH